MSYDPVTGKFKHEETSVANRMTGLLHKDTAYMQQAKAQGLQAANRRGLLHSSMAVQAAEAARIDRALPIASQDAAQANQRVMQGRDIQASELGQKRQIASTEGLATADRTSRETLTREGFAHERDSQAADIAGRERMLGTELASRERLQGSELASRERMQGLDNAVRQQMQALDVSSQERIAKMNVLSDERNRAAGLAASLEMSYSDMLARIMANPDIPAETRQEYMDHANRVRESNLALVEQFYNVDLEWEAA